MIYNASFSKIVDILGWDEQYLYVVLANPQGETIRKKIKLEKD